MLSPKIEAQAVVIIAVSPVKDQSVILSCRQGAEDPC
jgi:hypothetical protein